MKYHSRRTCLRLAGLGLGGLSLARLSLLPGRVLAQQNGLSLQILDAGSFLISADYTNVLGVAADDEVLLVGGVRAEDTEALLALIAEHTDRLPIRVAYNTHWHWDHTGSNEALRRQGAELLAHENTRLWLGNDFYVDWEDVHYSPRPPEALPTETFYEAHQLDWQGESVESGLLFQAHTDGDIYVHFPQRNILVTGDVVVADAFPVMDPVTGGWIGGLTEAQARLLELVDDQTRIIPGHGRVMNRADLQHHAQRLVELRERIFEFARQGKGPREMLEAGVAEGFEAWGDPTQFVFNAYPGLGRHYRDVDGVV